MKNKCPECKSTHNIKDNNYFECFSCGYWTAGTLNIYDARKLRDKANDKQRHIRKSYR